MEDISKEQKQQIVENLLNVLFVAADAKTDEQKARVAWRANDYMWWNVEKYGVSLCRLFNNFCDQQRWPKVKLWAEGERERMFEEKHGTSLQTPDISGKASVG
jgi:predicted lipoprotein